MKNSKINFKTIGFFVVFIAIVSSCSTKPTGKPSSSGKTCEILVVIDKNKMDGEIGDSLRGFFMREQDGLNQAEPLYTMPYIPLSSFENTDMFQAHRNIIMVNINDSCKTRLQILKDFKSKPQLIFKLSAKNNLEFFKLFAEKRELMLKAIDDLERNRINAAFKAVEKVEIKNHIRNTYAFDMTFPSEFSISKKTKDFSWIRKEAKDFSQGIMIYLFSYTDKNDLSPSRIIAIRDSLTKQWIPGPTDGSFMKTEKRFAPISKEINFNGLYAVETRGLWCLENDFMGGPFINYTFVDEKNNRIIMLDGYLYSPKKPKRDLLKQIEAIIYTYRQL